MKSGSEKFRKLVGKVIEERDQLSRQANQKDNLYWSLSDKYADFKRMMAIPECLVGACVPKSDPVYAALVERVAYNHEKEKENGGMVEIPGHSREGGIYYADLQCPAAPFYDARIALGIVKGRIDNRIMGKEEYDFLAGFLTENPVEELDRLFVRNAKRDTGARYSSLVDKICEVNGYWTTEQTSS